MGCSVSLQLGSVGPTQLKLGTERQAGRAVRQICQHSQSGCASAASGVDDADAHMPYDQSRLFHRLLLRIFRPIGLMRLWELLDDRMWVAGLVFVLGCCAGAAQGLSGKSQGIHIH